MNNVIPIERGTSTIRSSVSCNLPVERGTSTVRSSVSYNIPIARGTRTVRSSVNNNISIERGTSTVRFSVSDKNPVRRGISTKCSFVDRGKSHPFRQTGICPTKKLFKKRRRKKERVIRVLSFVFDKKQHSLFIHSAINVVLLGIFRCC